MRLRFHFFLCNLCHSRATCGLGNIIPSHVPSASCVAQRFLLFPQFPIGFFLQFRGQVVCFQFSPHEMTLEALFSWPFVMSKNRSSR